MKKPILIILSIIFTTTISLAQEKAAYQIFTSKGEKLTYKDMLLELAKANIVFFGEYHDNPIAHWMEYEITKDMYKMKEANIILGAEMFEADDQLVLNEYLQGLIKTDKFESDCRLWPNYKTDYKPLVEFAKEHKVPFIATNVPRRYASVVFNGGFEALEELSDEAKQYFPPLPIPYDPELNCYKAMMQMGGGPMHANANLPKAQAIKDATMAHFILKYFEEGKCFIHFNGSFHSDNKEGIAWYVKQANENLLIKNLSTVLQENIGELEEENKGIADYIIVISETMTRTY